MSTQPPNPAAAFGTDDERWAAVLTRDPEADGAFVYAVRTTGIYCRPTCPSRRPRRENVEFHPTGDGAAKAGFRSCRRCRPDEKPRAAEHAELVARACRLIEEADEAPHLEELAAAVGMSRFHFHRVFKSITGVTPKAYAATHRAERVRDALLKGGTVTDAIYEAGFNSSGRFYAAAVEQLGMLPKRFQAGGQGTVIRFAVGECSLGSVLVAATSKGVCAILLGEEPDRLVRDLQDRFPKAELIGGDEDFEAVVAAVVGFVESPTGDLGLPLHVRGTAFQHRVWRALRAVPSGATVSYAEIAQRIGAPKAVRAVAQACASNHLAVAIPCHRVVRADGALSGYRWGVERKRAILDREARA